MQNVNNSVAILVVDVQADFTEYKNGALPAPSTDATYINQLTEETANLKKAGYTIFASQDWHPKNHTSFYTNHPDKKPYDVINIYNKEQILWPPHCVQNTPGAELLLDKKLFEAVIHKGIDSKYDSYSAFHDDCNKPTGLDKLLKEHNTKKIVIYGIATDYCVLFSTLDAIKIGYKTIVIQNLCRGINPETTKQALHEMQQNGVIVLNSNDEPLTTFLPKHL